jgi:hypothetical protein
MKNWSFLEKLGAVLNKDFLYFIADDPLRIVFVLG